MSQRSRSGGQPAYHAPSRKRLAAPPSPSQRWALASQSGSHTLEGWLVFLPPPAEGEHSTRAWGQSKPRPRLPRWPPHMVASSSRPPRAKRPHCTHQRVAEPRVLFWGPPLSPRWSEAAALLETPTCCPLPFCGAFLPGPADTGQGGFSGELLQAQGIRKLRPRSTVLATEFIPKLCKQDGSFFFPSALSHGGAFPTLALHLVAKLLEEETVHGRTRTVSVLSPAPVPEHSSVPAHT